VGCVNLISSIGWAVLIEMLYDMYSIPPSKPRVALIMETTGIGLGMKPFFSIWADFIVKENRASYALGSDSFRDSVHCIRQHTSRNFGYKRFWEMII